MYTGMVLPWVLSGLDPSPQKLNESRRHQNVCRFTCAIGSFTTCSSFLRQSKGRGLLEFSRFAHSQHFHSTSPQHFLPVTPHACLQWKCASNFLCGGSLLLLAFFLLRRSFHCCVLTLRFVQNPSSLRRSNLLRETTDVRVGGHRRHFPRFHKFVSKVIPF